MFSAAIFDMDGLLLDSERIITRAWQSAAADAGIMISDADFFTVIGHAAPHAEVILARLLGSTAMVQGVDPSQCLAFEDSHNGIRAALAAGMQVVAVPDLLAPDTSACLTQLASLTHALEHVDIWFPGKKTNFIA